MISPTIGSDHSRRIPCQSVRELHFSFLFIFVCFQQVFVHITYLCSRCEMSVTFGQLSLASPGIAKSSTSFGWGLRRKCHLCRVAGNTVWSRIAREFQLRCGNVTLRTAIQDTLLYFTSGSVTLSETHLTGYGDLTPILTPASSQQRPHHCAALWFEVRL